MSGDGNDCNGLGLPSILSSKYCDLAAKTLSLNREIGDTCITPVESRNYPTGCYFSSEWDTVCFNDVVNVLKRAGTQNICQNYYGIMFYVLC